MLNYAQIGAVNLNLSLGITKVLITNCERATVHGYWPQLVAGNKMMANCYFCICRANELQSLCLGNSLAAF